MGVEALAGRKVLVTGGSGFIASHLVSKLCEIGAEVTVLTKYNSVIDNVRLAKLWDRIGVLEGDLRNLDSLKQIKDLEPEYVFHFAAYNHVGDSFLHVQESLACNAVGTANLLESYGDYVRFVYIATSEVYGFQSEVPFREEMTPFPTSPYAIGKYAGELYAQMQRHVYQKPVAIVRPFNCFGPYQSPRAVIAEMIIKCLRGEPIEATEGKQTREFNYVSNLVEGFLLAATHEKAIGETINLGCGEEIAIRDLISKIHSYTNSRSELRIGSLPYRPTEIWRMKADGGKAAALMGWKPTIGLDEGLKLTIDWYRRFLGVFTDDSSALLAL